MFCPICKSEYRFGFTRCSDCGVDLVEHLQDEIATPEAAGDPNEKIVLWAGVRSATRQAIEKALDDAKIEYELDYVVSQLMPAFREKIYRVRVKRGDASAAVAAVANIEGENFTSLRSPAAVQDQNSSFLDVLGFNRDLLRGLFKQPDPLVAGPEAEQADPGDTPPEPEGDEASFEPARAPGQFAEDFYPEDATAEVWSGEDGELAENIENCLREVGIESVALEMEGKRSVRVMPQSEARAKEIVREILEAAPPE